MCLFIYVNVCLFIYFIPLDFFFFRLFADILICLSYALHINPILFDIFVPSINMSWQELWCAFALNTGAYETFRNFKIRVADYIRYRKITSNMNDRFPDATAEELNV